MEFIALGELLIDFLPGSEEGSYVRNAGGAPANVAISAARNGLKSGMYCKVGNDDLGRFLMEALKENQVMPLSPELTDEAITTMAFVTLGENNERSFTFARKPGADMMLDPSEIKEEDFKDCRMLHTGSFTLSAGKAVEATEYAMKKAREMECLVAFDINYRDMPWNNDKEACAEKVMEILPDVDFLKISDEEIDMVGGRENVFTLMEEKNISVVVLTLGSEGAECFFKGTSFVTPGYKADYVADTTGAGDAFWGGFLSRLLNLGVNKVEDVTEEILRDAVKYGNVSGSLAVREKGAIASLPTKEQIESFLMEHAE